ncbi:hypothetical protein A11S_325 [Micavibrio aeruginosavorus EPB]|uniref:Uncharacterized protein n=1 Tax=Micavibrio aeruginosavorus EPB TaxID=349215 RepID=M4VF98_9BACT|nr:hypothetical protein A11S_325 [Micavibrio aeruginosavorus EPB]
MSINMMGRFSLKPVKSCPDCRGKRGEIQGVLAHKQGKNP